MPPSGPKITIVLIDDDILIRQTLKVLLHTVFKKEEVQLEAYSASEGVEGLGLIYVTKPDVIIIDTSLPRYSGREVIDYLVTNPQFSDKQILVLHDGSVEFRQPSPNFILLNKKNGQFIDKLTGLICQSMYAKADMVGLSVKVDTSSAWMRQLRRMSFIIRKFLIKRVLKWGNISDVLMYRITRSNILMKLLMYPLWVAAQVISSVYLALLVLVTPQVTDSNITQKQNDLREFRVRAYPTLVTMFTAFLFLMLQVSLFVTGGIVVFNSVKVQSIFANTTPVVQLDFNNTEYDPNLIELIDGQLRLKHQVVAEEQVPAPESQIDPELIPIEGNVEQLEENTETQPVIEQEIIDSVEVPPADSVSPEPEVLGASTESESIVNDFSADRPLVTFLEEIPFTTLISLTEVSSVLAVQDNQPVVDGVHPPIGVSELSNRSLPANVITYQLSPDGINWYYYSAEGKWEVTEAGSPSSNPAWEVNQFIANYAQDVGTDKVRLRAYLHSDGVTQITLNSLTVERELDIVSEVVNAPEQSEEADVVVIPTGDELPVPVLLNATFGNGQKVVSGKIAPTIDEATASAYRVRVYYSQDGATATKGQYIGESVIGKVTVNGEEFYAFKMRAASAPGGYVTAELVHIAANGTETTSGLATPIENSTFTVTQTSDESDADTGDPDCDIDGGTPLVSECTLRAAIQQANASAGSDIINFNIPASDAGYRDVDDPNTSSSGDSTGGDDYWTIRPATNLPAITETVTINGATQTTMQGNMNVNGPEIELNGVSDATNPNIGLQFNSGAVNSSVNSLVVNGFDLGSGYGIYLNSADGFTLTRSYLGTNVTGMSAAANREGLYAATSTGLTIGTNIANTNLLDVASDGNLISGNNNTGITLACGTTGTAKTAEIAGNVIGLNRDGSGTITMSGWTSVYGTHECDVQVGGDTVNKRNYIGLPSDSYGLEFEPNASDVVNIEIYNNFIGVDFTGTQLRAGSGDDWPYGIGIYGTLHQTETQNPIMIGAPGKGNLIRAGNRGECIEYNGNRETIIQHNTADCYEGFFSWGSSTYVNYQMVQIKNNYMGNTSSDPYFGVAIDSTSFERHSGIYMFGGGLVAQGNYIDGFAIGIGLQDGSQVSRGQIGGSGMGNTGSLAYLCEGGSSSTSEKNCIVNNGLPGQHNFFDGFGGAGIYMQQSFLYNEGSIATDNIYGVGSSIGNGLTRNENVKSYWYGRFELFSGTNRRTDFANGTLTFTFPSDKRVIDNNQITSTTNRLIACSPTSNCPAAGHTSGTDTMTNVFGTPAAGNSIAIYNFSINQQLQRVDEQPWDVDLPHFASKDPFLFGGNVAAYPVNTGSERTINTLSYFDRGEEWVNNPTYNADQATGAFGRNQIMELEFVDANPVYDNRGTIADTSDDRYVITVDSTTDEDNVSSAGFDDGAGAYSGGGYNGPSGLSNGKTSLREAILARNNFTTAFPVEIHFNIPTSDTGYRDVDDPNTNSSGDSTGGDDYWTIRPTTNLPTITKPVKIDGGSQETNTGSNRNTSGPDIELNGVSDASGVNIGLDFGTASDGSAVNSLVVGGFDAGGFSSVGINVNSSDNFILTRSYVGSNVLGASINSNGNGLIVTASTGVVIGNNVSDGNVISGNSQGLYIPAGNSGTARSITFKGNKIGLNASGTAALHPGGFVNLIWAEGDYSLVLGGDDATTRNYIMPGSNGEIFWIDGNNNGVTNIEMYNNYFALDINGNPLTTANASPYLYHSTGVSTSGSQAVWKIGAEGKGNTFYTTNAYVISESKERKWDVGYNTFIGKSTTLYFTGNTQTNIHHNNFVFLAPATGDGALRVNWFSAVKLQRNTFTVPDNRIAIQFGGDDEFGLNGIVPNDAGDVDASNWPNLLMNHPTITSVEFLGLGQYKVRGTLDGNVTEAPFQIEVCRSVLRTFGDGVCTESLGLVTTSASPTSGTNFNWEATVTVSGDNGTQTRYFTAIATNKDNRSSQFGPNTDGTYSVATYPVSLVYPISAASIDDLTPRLDWNPSALDGVPNPDVDHYEIYLDGNYYAQTANNVTDFQIASPLDLGAHQWQVIAFRANGIETGRSGLENFTTVETNYSFDPIYPVDITVDDRTPIFDWTDIDPAVGANVFDLYINDSLVKADIPVTTSEYELDESLRLGEGDFTWYVVAQRVEPDTSKTEVGRSETASFSVDVLYTVAVTVNQMDVIGNQFTGVSLSWNVTGTPLPTTGNYVLRVIDSNGTILIEKTLGFEQTSYTLTTEELALLDAQQIYDITVQVVDISPLGEGTAQLAYIVIATTSGSEAAVAQDGITGLLTRVKDSIPTSTASTLVPVAVGGTLVAVTGLGLLVSRIDIIGLLVGLLIPRKRKYWGIVYDVDENKPLPFAQVQVETLQGKVVMSAVSDLDGRYALLVNTPGTYRLKTSAGGYKPYANEVHINEINPDMEILADIGMRKSGERVHILNRIRYYLKSEVVSALRMLLISLLVIGMVHTFYVVTVNPVLINVLVLLGYIAVGMISIFWILESLRSHIGEVVEVDSQAGVPGATLRVYSGRELIGLGLTNQNGKVKLRLKPGLHDMHVNKVGYELDKQEEHTERRGLLELVKVNVNEGGFMKKRIRMIRTVQAPTSSDQLDNPFTNV